RGLTIIERQARRLTRLVDDLLETARITNGKVLLDCQRIDLADVIEAALETASPLFDERRHRVEAQVSRNLTVDADRARMEQVIANLLTNAAKYTAPGGRITLDAHRADGWITVCVSDTGIGISSEMLTRVFDAFVQGRQSLDRATGGLGLGLAIVRNLV